MKCEERYRAEFDDFLLIHPGGYFEPLVREIRQHSGLAGKRILELGCGTGALLSELDKHQPGMLTGVDVSQTAIDQARALLPAHIVLQCCNIEQPPGDLGSQDLVVSHSVLQYVPDLPALLSAVFNVLRPGGLFVGTLEHKSRLDALNLVQWLGFMITPRFVRRRYHWIVKPMLRFMNRDIPSRDILEGKSRYLGIPAVNCLSAQEVREKFEAAGFRVVDVRTAPRLDQNSVPHHLVIATKPERDG